MKANYFSTLKLALLIGVMHLSFSSYSQLNGFVLTPSGNTENYFKYIRWPVTYNNDSYFTGYLALTAWKNYSTGYLNDPGNPPQKLTLRGGNIILYSSMPQVQLNPISRNGAILFSDVVSTNYPNGKWGIEYETENSNGGLNFFMPPSQASASRVNFRLFLANDGNVGIGTSTPLAKLHVEGDAYIKTDLVLARFQNVNSNKFLTTDNTGKLVLQNLPESAGDNLGSHIATKDINMSRYSILNGNDIESSTMHNHITYTGQIFGDSKNKDWGKLEIFGSQAPDAAKIEVGIGNMGKQSISFLTNSSGAGFEFYADSIWAMVVKSSCVTIGNAEAETLRPTDLKVYGKVFCREVKVTLDKWYDEVFEPGYNLMPLQSLNDYISLNKHLPGIPSAQEVLQNGVNVGEMNALLLKKIEELTLYTLNQQKLLDQQQRQIDELTRLVHPK